MRCYTDTPSDNYYELCPTNIDAYAMPALIATFVMIGIVLILTLDSQVSKFNEFEEKLFMKNYKCSKCG